MTDIASLEKTLANQQWVGGQLPTAADKDAFEAVKSQNISAETHPNTFAWFTLTWKFSDAVRNSWAGDSAKPAKGGKAEAKPKGDAKKPAAKKDDDMDDLFGDDDGADAEAAAKAAKAAKEQAAGKKKKEVIAMSLVMLEVKPLDDTTSLDDLSQKIFSEITQEGLFWKTEYKKEPVAFGIFKLIIGFSCEDEKVSVDDIVEKIEAFDEFVQSVEIASFNKI